MKLMTTCLIFRFSVFPSAYSSFVFFSFPSVQVFVSIGRAPEVNHITGNIFRRTLGTGVLLIGRRTYIACETFLVLGIRFLRATVEEEAPPSVCRF